MSFEAKVVLASHNTHGQRLTTFLLTFPRYILAELNTHRMFTRNSASSRAIPFKKMVQAVKDNPFIPMKWMKDHPGMQGTEYFTDRLQIDQRDYLWLKARDSAITFAEELNMIAGVTKQMANRLLEPYMWHTALVTATEWENFFALRAHPAADIHIAHLAEMMLEAYNNAEVQQLEPGEWHIPFGDQITIEEKMKLSPEIVGLSSGTEIDLKIATARCAQTSYTVVGDGEKPMDYAKLIALHDRLAASGHWSPFEHCAQAMGDTTENLYEDWGKIERISDGKSYGHKIEYGWCGNFRGFIQYRKLFDNENRSDPRVKH